MDVSGTNYIGLQLELRKTITARLFGWVKMQHFALKCIIPLKACYFFANQYLRHCETHVWMSIFSDSGKITTLPSSYSYY